MPKIIETPGYAKAKTVVNGQPSEATAKLAFFQTGQLVIELIQPDETPSVWRDHLDKFGEGVHHIAFRVDSVDELKRMKDRLEAHGIEVLGVTDHHIFHSIYFFDPNGVRLELSAQLADEFEMLQESKTAHQRLRDWTARKEQWRQDRAAGKAAEPLKPQQNDRPEYVKK